MKTTTRSAFLGLALAALTLLGLAIVATGTAAAAPPGPAALPGADAQPPRAADPYTPVISETWVTEPISGVQLYTRILQPDPALYPGEQFPAVVVVPGGLGAGTPLINAAQYRMLVAQGFIVVGFNAPGRGDGQPGNLQSGGVEDCNGFAGQNALKAVVEYVAALPNVDAGNIGVQTSSYGITMGAGALGRYPDLPVQYLVDMEGPSNNLISTFYYAGQEHNHLCGYWSVLSDTSQANLDWWSEREAYRYIGDFEGYYLRAQAEVDHAQPPGIYTHTLEMVNTAVLSGVPWVRVNGLEMGNAISVTYVPTMPTWLPGTLRDYANLAANYIADMARRFGATVTPTWQIPFNLPHDVDRLPDGHTLVTAGDAQQSKLLELDAGGNVVAWYLGTLNFAHNGDRLAGRHTLLSDTGHDRVVELDAENRIIWSSEWITLGDGSALDYPNDVNLLPGDHLLITDRDNQRVIEIDRTGSVVWQFGQTGVPGSDAAHLDGPHNADRLADGHTLIADSNNNRVVEVDAGGTVVWTYAPGGAEALAWPRDADRLANGNTLITDSNNDRVIEVTPAGEVVWAYDAGLDRPYDADRLDNGHTLIADSGHGRFLEVDGEGNIVWQVPPNFASDSPFGFHPASVVQPGYPDNGYSDALNIGVGWTREGLYAYWFLVQPNLGQPVYDFSLYDQMWAAVPEGIDILANIAPQGAIDEGRCLPGSWLPVDVAQYTAFVRATVERYDGDGLDDMPGLTNPIWFWQVGNEPNLPVSYRTDFAGLQLMTYGAIKDACAACTVLIGGVAGFPADYVAGFDVLYAPILAELNGQGVDVFDFHWYGAAGGEYRLADATTGQDVLAQIRATLVASGFSATLPIWITEMGAYSGNPAAAWLPAQTERQQAGDYFKRFIYPLSRGVEKVFPAFGLMEGFKHDDGYFDHTGLIYDGQDSGDLGLGVKKLAYYTYQKMTEELAGADWDSLSLLHDGTAGDHLYLFRLEKGGVPLHIAWWDYFDEPGYTPGDTKPITLTGLTGMAVAVTAVVPAVESGQEVADEASAFPTTFYPIVDGSVTLSLGQDPVLVAEVAGTFRRYLPLILK